jgi:hypothetical protein
MAITYTWTVTNMSVLQTPQPDFVVIANWLCSGVEGAYSAEINGTEYFPDVQGDSFVPYADLTETLVLEWVTAALGENGVTSAESCVEGQINSEKNPPASPTSEPLPW